MPIINTVTGGGKGKFIDTTIKPDSFPTISEPPAPYDGWSKVTVEAPDNLDAQNIKEGVVIAGVEGSYSPPLQSKTEVPYSFPIVVEKDDGYYGLSDVTVTKPDNLDAQNIKKGVDIAGVTGTYDPQPSLEVVDVKPAVLPMTVVPDTDYDGLKQVNIEKPDNLNSENIKKDVNIAGVVGTYEGSVNKLPLIYNKTLTELTEDDFGNADVLGSEIQFDGCFNLKKVYLPDTITKIRSSIFEDTGIEEIKWSSNLIEIGSSAFRNGYKSKTLDIPPSVVKLGQLCFSKCDMESITIPDSISTLPFGCFMDNRFRGDVTIPASVTSIGDRALYTYYGLEYEQNFIFKSIEPPVISATYVFCKYTAGLTITVPKGSLEAYKSATNWAEYADFMVEADE